MEIYFCEEFPTKKNFEKLKLIKFKSRLFITAKSLDEFRNFEKQAKKNSKNIKCAYCPIVRNSYWVSPFSNTKDLINLFNELKKCHNHLLIDLELPLNKRLIWKNMFNYFKNRKIIKDFLKNNKNRIITAQFPISILSPSTKIIGLDYDI